MDVITLHDILKLIAALGFVLALMGGLALAVRKFGLAQGIPRTNSASRRLKVIESLSLDPRRRAVLIRCDDKDHLVILGPNGETVVTGDLKSVEEKK
jgi:flagellar protein FliO/FliZ